MAFLSQFNADQFNADKLSTVANKQVPWHWIYYLLVVCIAFPLLWSAPLVDEPVMVYTGWQVAQGKLLYRDVFEFVMPGTAVLIAGVIKLLGGSLPITLWPVLRGLNLLLWLLSMQVMEGFMETLALKPQWRWLYRLSMTDWLLSSPLLLLQITHHLYSGFFAVCGVGCMGRYLGDKDKAQGGCPQGWLILSGLCFGLSSCFTQTLGVCVGGCLFLSLVFYTRLKRELLWYVGACLLPVLLVSGYFVVIGEFPVYFDSVVGFLLHSGYKELDSFPYQPLFFNVLPLLSNISYVITRCAWFLKPVIFAILASLVMQIAFLTLGGGYAVWSLLRSRREGVQNNSLLALSAIGFFVASLSSPTTYLFGFHSWFLVLLGMMFLSNLDRFLGRFSQKTAFLRGSHRVFSSILLMMFVVQLTVSKASQLVQSQKLKFSLQKSLPILTLGEFEFEVIENKNKVFSWIKLHSDPARPISLFVFNNSPEFYLTLEAENPTKYRYLMPIHDPPQQQRKALEQLQQKPPQWMIWDHASAMSKANDPRYRNISPERLKLVPEFRQWVLRHYRRVFEAYPYVVYERR